VRNAAWLSMRKQPITAHSDLATLALEGQLCAWDVSRWQGLQVYPGAAPQAVARITGLGMWRQVDKQGGISVQLSS
jgi:hypothetical protein